MKINVNQIPLEGLTLEEQIDPCSLELETELVKASGLIKVKAGIAKITNAVTADVELNAALRITCSRCLKEAPVMYRTQLKLSYLAEPREPEINMDKDIREYIMLEYPIKTLCKPDCKGLCPQCGKNLNEGGCSCAIT
ncbi:MAG: DUF177 domain-containing protein [Candidatus Omnitrophota bacterium]|jgi:uncharacterized metal-binding protein YceD (DUF177 family)|nr:MAG: DUF177 domain-containing protein [Candidatus Omnitrophota bacterium]